LFALLILPCLGSCPPHQLISLLLFSPVFFLLSVLSVFSVICRLATSICLSFSLGLEGPFCPSSLLFLPVIVRYSLCSQTMLLFWFTSLCDGGFFSQTVSQKTCFSLGEGPCVRKFVRFSPWLHLPSSMILLVVFGGTFIVLLVLFFIKEGRFRAACPLPLISPSSGAVTVHPVKN